MMHQREKVMDMKNMMHTKNIMHKRENLMQQKKLNARTTVCYVVGWQMHTGALRPALQTCMHADVEDMAQATCEHIHHCPCFHRLVVSLPLFPNLTTHIRH